MQISGKSFKDRLLFSLISFAVISLTFSISIFILIDRIYKSRITSEIHNMTEIIAQSIDNFIDTPDSYLTAIKEHLNTIGAEHEKLNNHSLIDDIIEFSKAFESVYQLDKNGTVIKTWPYDENYIGIDLSNQEYFSKEQIFYSNRWSDVFISNITGLPTVALTCRCNEGMIVAYYNLNQLGKFVSIKLKNKNDFIAVLDKHGNIIAHTDTKRAALTENLSNMPSIKAALHGDFGVYEDYYQSTRGLVSTLKSEDSGFIVLVFKSYYGIFKKIHSAYTVFLILLITVTVFFGFLISLFLKNFLKPMDELQNSIKLVASGSYGTLPQSDFTEFMVLTECFVSMVNKVRDREKDLKTAIEDRETLLRELNHRTKNNMQLVTSIINLYQTKQIDFAPFGVIKEIQSKIETISLVHDKLYRDAELSSINFKEYLEELIPALIMGLSNPKTKIIYDLDIADINLLIDYVVPCGLVINELVINSLKHAFNSSGQGKIEISCKMLENNELKICYSDDGTGLPDSFDISQTQSLGFTIISNIISSQLNGNLLLEPHNGFTCSFKFKMNTYKNRI